MLERAGRGAERGLNALVVAASELAGEDIGALDGGALGERLVTLRHAADLIELEVARVSGAFAETDEYDQAGYATPLHWIRKNCKMASYAAGAALAVGRHADQLQESVAAVRHGSIGFAHLGLIARTAEALHEAGRDGDFDESHLLKLARNHSVGRFGRDCYHQRHGLDPAGALAEHVEMVALRSLEVLPRTDGAVTLHGFLDPELGTLLRTALDPLARRMDAKDSRPRWRRYGDALFEFCNVGLQGGGLPRTGGQRPHLQVTTTLETLMGAANAPGGELQHGAPVPVATVQRLACDASVTRILLGPESVITDVGRAVRVPGPALRRALQSRDRECVWPGCERSAPYTAAHHLVHWAHGGRTDLENLVLLCHRHHWMVHEGGWQIAKGERGAIIAVSPVHEQLRHLAPDDG